LPLIGFSPELKQPVAAALTRASRFGSYRTAPTLHFAGVVLHVAIVGLAAQFWRT